MSMRAIAASGAGLILVASAISARAASSPDIFGTNPEAPNSTEKPPRALGQLAARVTRASSTCCMRSSMASASM
jgi:hypothetical protein